MQRPDTLARFIDATREAAVASTEPDSDAAVMIERIFAALKAPSSIIETPASEALPAYNHLPDALSNATRGSSAIRTLSEALGGLAPELSWQRRVNAETQGERFYNGHANTIVVGPDGLEQRSDILIGVSLVAPDVWYPEHNHPPEEVYVVMSEGEWYREEAGWYTPGMGSVVYHQPWITHAMRSGSRPLLAVWCLWTGADKPDR